MREVSVGRCTLVRCVYSRSRGVPSSIYLVPCEVRVWCVWSLRATRSIYTHYGGCGLWLWARPPRGPRAPPGGAAPGPWRARGRARAPRRGGGGGACGVGGAGRGGSRNANGARRRRRARRGGRRRAPSTPRGRCKIVIRKKGQKPLCPNVYRLSSVGAVCVASHYPCGRCCVVRLNPLSLDSSHLVGLPHRSIAFVTSGLARYGVRQARSCVAPAELAEEQVTHPLQRLLRA